MYIYFILWDVIQYFGTWFVYQIVPTLYLIIKGFIICKRDELNEITLQYLLALKDQELLKNHLKVRYSKISFSICLLIPDYVGLALGSTSLTNFLGHSVCSFIWYWHQRTYVCW